MKLKILINTKALGAQVEALRNKGIILWKWLAKRTRPGSRNRLLKKEGLLTMMVEALGPREGRITIKQVPVRRVYKLAGTLDDMTSALSATVYGYIMGGTTFVKSTTPVPDEDNVTYNAGGHVVSELVAQGRHDELVARLCKPPATLYDVASLVANTQVNGTDGGNPRFVYWYEGQTAWTQFDCFPTSGTAYMVLAPVGKPTYITKTLAPGFYDRVQLTYTAGSAFVANEFEFTLTFGVGVALPMKVGCNTLNGLPYGFQILGPAGLATGGVYAGVVTMTPTYTSTLDQGVYTIVLTLLFKTNAVLHNAAQLLIGDMSTVTDNTVPGVPYDAGVGPAGHLMIGPATTGTYISSTIADAFVPGFWGAYTRPENVLWYTTFTSTSTYYGSGLYVPVGSFGDALAEFGLYSEASTGALYSGVGSSFAVGPARRDTVDPYTVTVVSVSGGLIAYFSQSSTDLISKLYTPALESPGAEGVVVSDFAMVDPANESNQNKYRVVTADGTVLGYRCTTLPVDTGYTTQVSGSTVSVNTTATTGGSTSTSASGTGSSYYGFPLFDSYSSTTTADVVLVAQDADYYRTSLVLPAAPQVRAVYDTTSNSPAFFGVHHEKSSVELAAALAAVDAMEYTTEAQARTDFAVLGNQLSAGAVATGADLINNPPPAGALGDPARFMGQETVLLLGTWSTTLNDVASSTTNTLDASLFASTLATCRAALVARQQAGFVGVTNAGLLPAGMKEQLEGGLYIIV